MKKLILFVMAITISVMTTFGQKVAPVKDTMISATHKSALMEGRRLYLGVNIASSTPPNPYYGLSFEGGVWGTVKPTSIALCVDWLKNDAHSAVNSNDTGRYMVNSSRYLYVGPKVYLTVLNDKSSCWMVYVSPKVNVKNISMSELFEVGINPCYYVGKHLIINLSVCNQFTRTATWNIGGSFGLAIMK
jgi:hypothetical protein